MKKTLMSIALGLVLAIVPMAILAACAPTYYLNGTKCVLVGSNCGGGVCVCAYNCGPNPN